jgi:hypothetical protein
MEQQYHNQPAQMNHVVTPQAATYSQQAPVTNARYAQSSDPFAPPSGPPPPLQAPPALPTAKVIQNYAARQPSECTIHIGEVVQIIKVDPSGWTEVVSSVTGARGWVPVSSGDVVWGYVFVMVLSLPKRMLTFKRITKVVSTLSQQQGSQLPNICNFLKEYFLFIALFVSFTIALLRGQG